jgi:hypothetical protein
MSPQGTVALSQRTADVCALCGTGEFGERHRDASVGAGFDPEFVVTSPEVLWERVTVHDHAGSVVAFESPHRAQPGLEAALVGLDPIVRVPARVVERGRDEVIDDRAQRPGSIGYHLSRDAVTGERSDKESASGTELAARGDKHVDDLAVLIDGAVDVASPTRDLHRGCVHVPPITEGVATRPRRVDQQRGEALHPPVHGDVIDLAPRAARSSSTSRYESPNRKYQRTASTTTSRGNRKPANDDIGTAGT